MYFTIFWHLYQCITHTFFVNEKKKHILILSSWFPTKEHPFLGNFIERQAELVSRLHTVTLIRFEPGNAPQTPFTITQNGAITTVCVYYSENGTFIRRFISKNRAFKKAIRTITGVDLIHGHVCFPNGLFFLKAKRYYKCPLVLTEHASYYDPNVRWTQKMNLVIPRSIRSADYVVAVSDFLKEDIQKRFPRLRVGVIPNHIDTDAFVPKHTVYSGTFHLLHVSTLAPIKRIAPIIQAVEALHHEGVDIHLTIVSDEDYTDWAAFVDQKGLGSVITFAGPLSWHETIPFYQQAHCFVLDSAYETFSIVLAEAMSCGLPVIATKVGLASGLSDEYGEFLRRDHSQKALEEAIRKVMSHYNHYSHETIRNFALQYNSENVLKQLTQLYEQARLRRPFESPVA